MHHLVLAFSIPPSISVQASQIETPFYDSIGLTRTCLLLYLLCGKRVLTVLPIACRLFGLLKSIYYYHKLRYEDEYSNPVQDGQLTNQLSCVVMALHAVINDCLIGVEEEGVYEG